MLNFALNLLRLAAGIWFFAANTVSAAEYRVAHCLKGCPEGVKASNQLIVRSVYALSYDADRGAADWLAYRMRPGALGIASSLSRAWIEDPDLPGQRDTLEAQNEVAETLGMVRARLVGLVSVAGTPYWHEANLMSASTLRTESLDRGAWAGLEWSLRNLVNRRGDIYVITGPIYDPSKEAAELPIAFYKLIASDDGALSAFRFDQSFGVYLHHCEARSSLEEIEALTGMRFFPEWEHEEFRDESLDVQLGCR